MLYQIISHAFPGWYWLLRSVLDRFCKYWTSRQMAKCPTELLGHFIWIIIDIDPVMGISRTDSHHKWKSRYYKNLLWHLYYKIVRVSHLFPNVTQLCLTQLLKELDTTQALGVTHCWKRRQTAQYSGSIQVRPASSCLLALTCPTGLSHFQGLLCEISQVSFTSHNTQEIFCDFILESDSAFPGYIGLFSITVTRQLNRGDSRRKEVSLVHDFVHPCSVDTGWAQETSALAVYHNSAWHHCGRVTTRRGLTVLREAREKGGMVLLSWRNELWSHEKYRDHWHFLKSSVPFNIAKCRTKFPVWLLGDSFWP